MSKRRHLPPLFMAIGVALVVLSLVRDATTATSHHNYLPAQSGGACWMGEERGIAWAERTPGPWETATISLYQDGSTAAGGHSYDLTALTTVGEAYRCSPLQAGMSANAGPGMGAAAYP